MGVDRNTSIGVYMIVEGEKTEMIERSVNACSDEECDNYKSNKEIGSKFCPRCASLIKPKLFKEEFKKTPRGFLNDLEYKGEVDEDALSWTDPMGCGGGVWIANKYSPFDEQRKSDPQLEKYDEVVDLTNVVIPAEIEWFKKEYKKIIETFKKEFGEDSVRIGWGVIEWYS